MTNPDAATSINDPRTFSFRAVPDKGEVRVKIRENGLPNPIYPNVLPVPLDLQAELARVTQVLWYPHKPEVSPPSARWIVNHCADADEYRDGLVWLDEVYGGTTPIFNHPRAVARSRRDHSSTTLRGIEGLVVPRVARLRATSRAAFERCFHNSGFRFPVLVRPCRSQTGRGLLKIERSHDWDQAVNTIWFGQPHFMTEFVDFGTDDGVYLKARVIFVAERFFIRHIKGATGWKVHNDTDNSIADFEEREMELIEKLNQNQVFLGACSAIPARTGLDFCGMDVGVNPERNQFVMFECNAAMSVFSRSYERIDAERQARRDRLQIPAAEAFEKHLLSPEGWVWNNCRISREEKDRSCREMMAE